MSVEAIAWAFKQDVSKSSHKFVLVAACDWASDGELFASIPSLAKKTAMNEKTVRAALHWLAENGFIEPTGERRGHTKQVIVYRLNTPKNGRVKDSQKREATKNGSLPKTDPDPPKNGRVKDSQKREADTQALNSRDTQEGKRATAKRGTRLPDDWQPSETEMRWAADARPDLDLNIEVEKFRDHWHAEPGARAAKLDWSATWRNWIRRANGPPRGRYAPPVVPSPATSRPL